MTVAIFGYIADRTRSPKGPFIAGLIALALSTALFMLARSPALFVIARGLQGFSGAAVWVAGLALVVDTVDDSRVAEAMGYTTMGMSMGSLLGPAAGGVLYDKLGFYGAFYVPIGLIILDVILRVVLIEPSGMTFFLILLFHYSQARRLIRAFFSCQTVESYGKR